MEMNVDPFDSLIRESLREDSIPGLSPDIHRKIISRIRRESLLNRILLDSGIKFLAIIFLLAIPPAMFIWLKIVSIQEVIRMAIENISIISGLAFIVFFILFLNEISHEFLKVQKKNGSFIQTSREI